MPPEHLRSGALDGGAVGDVTHLVLAADLHGERTQPVLAPREEDAVPAARREQPRKLGADARGRTGDDCYALHARTAS